MQKIYFKTFGCRTNIFDTQIMTNAFGMHQITQNENEADAIIINSCTVTNGADAGVRQYVNKIRTKKPDAKILFTGCGIDTLGQKLLDDGKIDGLFGASEKSRVEEFINSSEKVVELGNKEFVDTAVVSEISGKTRAYIKIQEGCDFECSYCIIPSSRGKSRSLPESVILTQVQTLCDKGFSEFTLTGTNVGSYKNLATLVRKICKLDGVKRLRLGSIEPCQVSDELIDAMSSPKFAKQLHVALQHTNDKILEAMKRTNRYESDKKMLDKLSALGFALGTDFIVGFPTESKEIWQDAFVKIKELPLTHIHPFIFSPRDGTDAASLKGAPKGDESKARLKELNDLIEQKNLAFRTQNSELIVHVEENESGFDQFYNRCEVKGAKANSYVLVKKYTILENKNEALEYEEWSE